MGNSLILLLSVVSTMSGILFAIIFFLLYIYRYFIVYNNCSITIRLLFHGDDPDPVNI
jgi:hypothetical protein